ncbi:MULTISPECIES: CAP domain-containing protein [Nocardiopsis]|uniref:Secretion protein n=1 Tax=Nocardiopsis sinuspersici TaxID=501010 RepID=A0A1V3BXP1_9ACTN|nr:MULTISPECIES: CAP domain-containing protein [Nocardiopsis]OOC53019.1 secretion protein [Nocardiopsis sinuspersici]
MARGRRGRRRMSAPGHRSPRGGRQRRGAALAVSLAAVPVGLVLAGALLVSGVGEGLNPFQNTADGQVGDQTGVPSAGAPPEASEDDDFFARPTTAPEEPGQEREPTPSGDSEPQSADVTASSIPEDSGGGGSDGGDGGGSDGNGSGGADGGEGPGGDGNGGRGEGDGGVSGSSAGSVADQVVTLANDERAEAGCGPLTVDPRLTAAAQEHSEDMARRDYMSHENPEGEGPGDRARRHGYDAWGAENVAKGQTSPQQVMDAWMNSDGHRRNILNCDLVSIGVGESGDAWTQMFGWE